MCVDLCIMQWQMFVFLHTVDIIMSCNIQAYSTGTSRSRTTVKGT